MILKRKNAIITGSNQGLGKAIAKKFIEEGANVLICARNIELLSEAEKELSTKLSDGQKLYSFPVDISNPIEVENLYTFARCVFENVDILVNNAGIIGVKGLAETTNFEEWTKTINVNLIGTVSLCMKFIPDMKNNKYGKIINTAGGGAANPRTYFSAYATSKAAVVRFSECIAEELKEFNIDVNCISPGALNTKILDEVLLEGKDKIGEEYYKKALKQKENGGSSLENAAEMIAFIASEKCDGVTGKLISAVWDNWKDIPCHKQELKNSDVYTLRRILPFDVNPYWMETK
jgi:NAD(P)-dependent dehydrogenase (short-subunit alcohol dehydrogenase family)